ncbi:MAG: Conserved protein of unknown function, PE-PGRS family protein (PE-PGRS 20) (part1) [Parcubacteria group bacterium Gr01-1014_31]|nr:MAG: Conserved protein of unknown function, PE-PGRS family protein (PE-PGRS 20) (part1) [Parcubacteria group bacterium Gr01-1014_31]
MGAAKGADGKGFGGTGGDTGFTGGNGASLGNGGKGNFAGFGLRRNNDFSHAQNDRRGFFTFNGFAGTGSGRGATTLTAGTAGFGGNGGGGGGGVGCGSGSFTGLGGRAKRWSRRCQNDFLGERGIRGNAGRETTGGITGTLTSGRTGSGVVAGNGLVGGKGEATTGRVEGFGGRANNDFNQPQKPRRDFLAAPTATVRLMDLR